MILVDDIKKVTKKIPKGIIKKLMQLANEYDLEIYDDVPDYFEPERIRWFAINISRVPDDVSITELVQKIEGNYEFTYGRDCLWFCIEAPTIRRVIVRGK
jgi:hypothetical protein